MSRVVQLAETFSDIIVRYGASLFRRFQTLFAENFDQIFGIAPRNTARVGYDSHAQIRFAIALANSEHVAWFHGVRRLRGSAIKPDKARVAKLLS